MNLMLNFRPTSSLLGQIPLTEIYVELNKYQNAKQIPGIIIFRFSSPIFYLNSEILKEHLTNFVLFDDR